MSENLDAVLIEAGYGHTKDQLDELERSYKAYSNVLEEFQASLPGDSDNSETFVASEDYLCTLDRGHGYSFAFVQYLRQGRLRRRMERAKKK